MTTDQMKNTLYEFYRVMVDYDVQEMMWDNVQDKLETLERWAVIGSLLGDCKRMFDEEKEVTE